MRTKSNAKIFAITWTCTAVAVFIMILALVKSHFPSQGKPYERLTVEEAQRYMSYEQDYVIVDVRDEGDYFRGHQKDAVNIPFGEIVARTEDLIADKGMRIYVYGEDEEESCGAAQKLNDMGYKNVAEIGSYSDWIENEYKTFTESPLEAELE